MLIRLNSTCSQLSIRWISLAPSALTPTGRRDANRVAIDWQARCTICPETQAQHSWKERVNHPGYAVVIPSVCWADCKCCPVRSPQTHKKKERFTSHEIAAPGAMPGAVCGLPTPTDAGGSRQALRDPPQAVRHSEMLGYVLYGVARSHPNTC
jgi:hypothetical protein